MKQIAAAYFCVLVLTLAAFGQTSKTSRPRVVVTDNTTAAEPSSTPVPAGAQPPTLKGDTSAQNQQSAKRPPVLIGDSQAKVPQTAPTPPAKTDTSDEVIEDDEVIRVETNLVTMPVSVFDRDGRFISGLRQSDFHIFEDGVEQKIDYFASVEQPFTVVLLLDVSASTKFKIDEIQNAAIAFIDQLRPADRVAVISFDQNIHVLTPPTNNRAVLRNAIRQTNFDGGTSLYEAVDYAINQQLKGIEGRKAVVLFTDGVDTTSKKATYESTTRQAEELEAMIYTIRYDTMGDMGGGTSSGGRNSGGGIVGAILGAILTGGNVQIGSGGGNSKAEYEKGRRYLEALSQNSGGRKFEAQSIRNLDDAFSGIAEELRQQYALGYYPDNVGQPGQRKQIKVRVDRQYAAVRAKNSYIVGQGGVPSTTAQTKPPVTTTTTQTKPPASTTAQTKPPVTKRNRFPF